MFIISRLNFILSKATRAWNRTFTFDGQMVGSVSVRVSPAPPLSPSSGVQTVSALLMKGENLQSISAEEIQMRRSLAIGAGFSDTIATEFDQLRSLQAELRMGLIDDCPVDILREWLTISLIVGEVLVVSKTGDLEITWVSTEIKFKLVPEADLLYMASYRWDKPEDVNGVAMASNTISYAKAVLEKRDHVWFDILSHFGGVGARAIVLAKMGSWYCDRIVIPVDYLVLEANKAFERTHNRAWIYQEQCIPALDIDILPESCYIHLAHVRCCLRVEVAHIDDSGDGQLVQTSTLPIEVRRNLRARFYRKTGSYLETVKSLRARADLAQALPGAVRTFEEGLITYEEDRPVACFAVIFKLAGLPAVKWSETSLEHMSACINLACLKCTDTLIYSGGRPGVRNIGIFSGKDGECVLPTSDQIEANDRWARGFFRANAVFWSVYIFVLVGSILLSAAFGIFFGPMLLWDRLRGTFRAKFSNVSHKIDASDMLGVIFLPLSWTLLACGRSLVFFLYNGKSGGRTACDEFSDIFRMNYILLRQGYRIWNQNILERVIKYWDLDEVFNVGSCRIRKDRVVVSHWITKLMAFDRKEWDQMIEKLAKEGKLGC
jgi:hypothetical protein